MQLLRFPLDPPHTVFNRIISDIGAIARAARQAPAQLDRMLELGEEIAAIGQAVLAIAERLDERAAEVLVVGERLDARAEAILVLGERIDGRAEAILDVGTRLEGRAGDLIDLGTRMQDLGDRVDSRGAEVASQAGAVASTATELAAVIPTLERTLALATPLEGAIERVGRLVDRLPGGRRPEAGGAPQSVTQHETNGPAGHKPPGDAPDPPAAAPVPIAAVPDEPARLRWPGRPA